jgi:hypothetical protein
MYVVAHQRRESETTQDTRLLLAQKRNDRIYDKEEHRQIVEGQRTGGKKHTRAGAVDPNYDDNLNLVFECERQLQDDQSTGGPLDGLLHSFVHLAILVTPITKNAP